MIRCTFIDALWEKFRLTELVQRSSSVCYLDAPRGTCRPAPSPVPPFLWKQMLAVSSCIKGPLLPLWFSQWWATGGSCHPIPHNSDQVSVLILHVICNAANNGGVIGDFLQVACPKVEVEVRVMEDEQEQKHYISLGCATAACHHIWQEALEPDYLYCRRGSLRGSQKHWRSKKT